MTVVRYEPWNLYNQLQDEINKVFQSRLGPVSEDDISSVVTSHWSPAVDIKEEADRFLLLADVPGVEPKDIEITMEHALVVGVVARRAHDLVLGKEGQFHTVALFVGRHLANPRFRHLH